jgi:hypothetical protein
MTRVPFDERQFDEGWLQDLLFRHPSLIPVDEIEPVFGPLVPIARELSTPSGPVDILYVSPEGYPTLVETKLWRNPEARRQVVAQAIDYGAQLSRWSYDELASAVKARRGDLADGDPFVRLMEEQAEDWDHARFVDTLARNLRLGRMLLLIVGDGIHEAVEHMAETLSRTPQLGFTLSLVEMALFRPPEKSEPLFVQPRIVMRTREVVRAIVEVRAGAKPEDVRVTLPPAEKPAPGGRYTLSEEAFLEKLEGETSRKIVEDLRGFLADVESRGVARVGRQASLCLHYIEPSTGGCFSLGNVCVDATVDMRVVAYYLRRAGFDEGIGTDYLDELARLVPRAKVKAWERKTGPFSAIKVGGRHVTIEELLQHRAEWLDAIERMIRRINDSAEATA